MRPTRTPWAAQASASAKRSDRSAADRPARLAGRSCQPAALTCPGVRPEVSVPCDSVEFPHDTEQEIHD